METDKFETEMVDGWRLESDDLVVLQTSDSLMLQADTAGTLANAAVHYSAFSNHCSGKAGCCGDIRQ